MERYLREDPKHKYCVLGPHRLGQNAHRIGTAHILQAFKSYVGSTHEEFRNDDQICNGCHVKVVNWGRKLGIIKKAVSKQNLDESSGTNHPSNDVKSSSSRRHPSVHDSNNGHPDIALESYPCPSHSNTLLIEDTVTDAFNIDHGQENQVLLQAEVSSVAESSQGPSQYTIRYSLDGIKSCSCSQKMCFVCLKNLTLADQKRSRPPKHCLFDLFQKHQVFVPLDLRCCADHVVDKKFSEVAIRTILDHRASTSCSVGETAFFEWVQVITKSGTHSGRYNFSDAGLPACDYPAVVGISKENFEDLFSHISPYMRNSCNRTKREALGIWLTLMKSANTQEHIGMDFNMEQRTVSDICSSVGDLVYEHFTTKNLGFTSITREDLINRYNTETARTALSIPVDAAIVICDGTYLNIDKPVDQEEQRFSFNGHKMANFQRMMMVTTCTGHIIACIGPFCATWNDAKVLEYVYTNKGLKEFLGPNPHIILDRGFRDCEQALTRHGVTIHSPEWMDKSEKQLSTIKAGKSRLVTMCRWPVEGANGRVKQKFRFFLRKINGRYSPSIAKWFQNCCGIVNKYGKPGFKESQAHVSVAGSALAKSVATSNSLHDRLNESGKMRLTPSWKKVNADDLDDFPKLSMHDLAQLAVGIYQINESLKYIAQHMKESGKFELRMHDEEAGLVRAQIHSRFQSAVTRSTWVEYVPGADGLAAITGYYCTCKAGLRVVGCCVHTMTVIRYLSYERYTAEGNSRASKRVKFLGVHVP